MKTNFKKQKLLPLLLTIALFSACKKETVQPASSDDNFSNLRTLSDMETQAIYSGRTIAWNGRSDATYTLSQAKIDFGNVLSGWNESRVHIRSQSCRITLLKDALSAAGGMIAYIDIADGTEYELEFDAKFHSEFLFRQGGKMGFGFFIGDGASGGSDARDGQGGSLRLVWHTESNITSFHAYAYHKDQPDAYGDTYGKYPATGSITQSTWYKVKFYFKANTGSSTNGRLKMTINNTVVVDRAMRWTTNDIKRKANKMCFSTFRGGTGAGWISPTTSYIYFDNLKWTRLAI